MLNYSRPWSNASRATVTTRWAPIWLIVASCVLAVYVTLAEPALNLRAKTLEGKSVQLSELFENRPVLLQFWRGCCRPCHRALAHLQEIHEQFSERGLVVVAISVDETRSIDRAASLLKTRDYGFTALFDPNQQAFKKVSGRAVPHTLLISADGRLVYLHIGYRDGDELKWRQAVEQMMTEWTAHSADSTTVETASPRRGAGDGTARQIQPGCELDEIGGSCYSRKALTPSRVSTTSPRRDKPMSMTRAQRGILQLLLAAEETGRAPSYREIACALGWRSAGTVDGHVRALVDRGWLERAKGQARGLRITPAGRRQVEIDSGSSRSLPQIPNLSGLERGHLEPLLPFMTRRRFRPRQVLWRQGDRDGFLAIVEQGHLQAYRVGPSAKRIPLLIFAPGDIFGFLPLLDGGPYPASVAAVDEVIAWVLHRPALIHAVRLQPDIALSLIGLLGTRLRGSFDRIEELSMQEALPRVASTLAALLPHSPLPGGVAVIEYPESGRALAEAVGITPETLSRIITRLEENRILHRMGGRRLQVLDVEGLKRAARPLGW